MEGPGALPGVDEGVLRLFGETGETPKGTRESFESFLP